MDDKNIYILGIHIGHDRCAAIIRNGEIVASIAEERLDRVKYSPGDEIPMLSIRTVLDISNLDPNQLDAIALTSSGILISDEFTDACYEEVTQFIKIDRDRFHIVGHHIAHAYAVYYTSPFERCAIMIADGAGDMLSEYKCEAESYYLANDGTITPFFQKYQSMPVKYGSPACDFRYDFMMPESKKMNISIGRKYEQITKLIGFSFGQAGKTMGLAPYGKPLCKSYIERLGMNHSLQRSDYLEHLSHCISTIKDTFKNKVEQHKSDIARDIQNLTEILLMKCIEEFSELTDNDNICLSGGVFLNCVANSKIIEKQFFKKHFFTPASGDDGQAIGAAFCIFNQVFGGTHRPHRHSPYLGKSYTLEECEFAARKLGLTYEQFQEEELLIDYVARQLAADKVIGVLKGRSEIGPRALGNRSILANPRSKNMKDHINHDIKFREDFRPFAPVVTYDDVQTYFRLNEESPHMLLTAQVQLEQCDKLPAVTHVDMSARIQTVKKEDNNFLYRLLKRFEHYSGIPVLLNTSFNTAREPIVESPDNAVSTFINSGLDILLMENIIIEK